MALDILLSFYLDFFFFFLNIFIAFKYKVQYYIYPPWYGFDEPGNVGDDRPPPGWVRSFRRWKAAKR